MLRLSLKFQRLPPHAADPENQGFAGFESLAGGSQKRFLGGLGPESCGAVWISCRGWMDYSANGYYSAGTNGHPTPRLGEYGAKPALCLAKVKKKIVGFD